MRVIIVVYAAMLGALLAAEILVGCVFLQIGG